MNNPEKRRICAIGETVYDILFRNNQPVAAVPGGSSFNSIISIGRTATPCLFVGYTGDDMVGNQTRQFLQDNGVDTAYFSLRQNEKSAISLAFLDENSDAHYTFYKDAPRTNPADVLPTMKAGDLMLFGSYYAICQGMRQQVSAMLQRAKENDSIVYYDVNFRSSHQPELPQLMPAIQSNMQASSVVRCSSDDCEVLFGTRDAALIYEKHIAPHCPVFIYTAGAENIHIFTPTARYEYAVPKVDKVVSTVGAGDNFNAGFLFALVRKGIDKALVQSLSEAQWGELVSVASRFASEACKTTDNYVSVAFAQSV